MRDEMPLDDGCVYHDPTIADLYRYRSYADPTYGNWEDWYAWHPVNISKWMWVSDFNRYIKLSGWHWGKHVMRRQVIDRLSGPGRESAGIKKHWEYSTMMDVMAYG